MGTSWQIYKGRRKLLSEIFSDVEHVTQSLSVGCQRIWLHVIRFAQLASISYTFV